MRLFKAVLALAALAVAYFAGSAALSQFEHFQEASHFYRTPFHEIDMIALVAVMVALLAFAIVTLLSDDWDADELLPIPFTRYLLAVTFGTAGVVAFALSIYESALTEGRGLPQHMGTVYHRGDTFVLMLVGVVLILVALYFLLADWLTEESGHGGAVHVNSNRMHVNGSGAPVNPGPAQASPEAAQANPGAENISTACHEHRCYGSCASAIYPQAFMGIPVALVVEEPEPVFTAVLYLEIGDDHVVAVYNGSLADVVLAAEELLNTVFAEDDEPIAPGGSL